MIHVEWNLDLRYRMFFTQGEHLDCTGITGPMSLILHSEEPATSFSGHPAHCLTASMFRTLIELNPILFYRVWAPFCFMGWICWFPSLCYSLYSKETQSASFSIQGKGPALHCSHHSPRLWVRRLTPFWILIGWQSFTRTQIFTTEKSRVKLWFQGYTLPWTAGYLLQESHHCVAITITYITRYKRQDAINTPPTKTISCITSW